MLAVERLEAILGEMRKLRVGVLGDFALDVYYEYVTGTGEVSLETGKPVDHGRSIRTSPGAAGNVAGNLAALRPAALSVFGLVGNDLYGRELLHHLRQLGAETDGLIVQPDGWTTQTYVKPLLDLEEQHRLDFGNFNVAAEASCAAVLARLRAAMPELDVLIVNEQFRVPLLSPSLAQGLNAMLAANSRVRVFSDCRDRAALLGQGVVRKLNTHEVAKLLEREAFDDSSRDRCRQHALAASEKLCSPVLMTRGENGLVVVHDGEVDEVPGLFILEEVDPVGAGDTCISAFGLALGAGASWAEAAEVANYAAGVTVRKLHQTGTASPEEIVACRRSAEFVYRPDLAADARLARYVGESSVEIVNEVRGRPVQHVILDHDGTLSVLREGWEAVMFEVALSCICGDRLAELDVVLYRRIADKVGRMIQLTTGIQTIQQMMHLERMVREEGLVPAPQILDAAGYKRRYLDRLMVTVGQRLAALERGERDIADFTIKGAVDLLTALHGRGLRLYLASGTDELDVRREATILGYAGLFDGGIFGSRGNELGDAKRQAIARILREAACPGDALMVIGDGPVEIREGRQVGALCLGVASDEIRRYGRNDEKRRRLIRAGADLIVPDWSQLDALMEYLF